MPKKNAFNNIKGSVIVTGKAGNIQNNVGDAAGTSSNVVAIKRKRLQLLEEQAALHGIMCPPHITMEIEELRKILGDK